jgi:hypothetical protein
VGCVQPIGRASLNSSSTSSSSNSSRSSRQHSPVLALAHRGLATCICDGFVN